MDGGRGQLGGVVCFQSAGVAESSSELQEGQKLARLMMAVVNVRLVEKGTLALAHALDAWPVC
jgi:hypothetical protein